MAPVSWICALEASRNGSPARGTSPTWNVFPQLKGGVADAAGDGRNLPGYPVTYPRKEREMGIFSRPQEEVDAADDKFWALRNSGWKGPIDHNGDKVEDMEQWIRDHS